MSDIYIYAKSGHKIGLDRVRRCSVLYKKLKRENPNSNVILATSDYRAATYANRILGVEKSLGVDIIHNMSNLMQQGDILYFDSDEVSNELKEDIKGYCSEVYEVGVDIEANFVDDYFKNSSEVKREIGFFYGDDDYNKTIFEFLGNKKYNFDILNGLYFFINYEDRLIKYFNNIVEEEKYFEFISTTKTLITSSPQAAIESKIAGNEPIFFQRKDKSYDVRYLKELNINIVDIMCLSNYIKEV